MQKLLSTREVAHLLGVNEKMVYTLISEKGLPATRITGKWVFPAHLVEQWVESKTLNYPRRPEVAGFPPGLLLVAGSDDILLDRALSSFMNRHPGQLALFGNLGSLGGLKALREGRCQIATCHLEQEGGDDFNFAYADRELDERPALVNFCRRELGLVVARGNPKGIRSTADLAKGTVSVVNRPQGTSTRLRFERELQAAGIEPEAVPGFGQEVPRHLDVGFEVLSGRADAGLAIRAVSGLLALDFVPLAWERFDLLIPKDAFFAPSVQLFLEFLHTPHLKTLGKSLAGYDLSLAGKMVYPREIQA